MSGTKDDPVIVTFVDGRLEFLALTRSLVDRVDAAEYIRQESWPR